MSFFHAKESTSLPKAHLQYRNQIVIFITMIMFIIYVKCYNVYFYFMKLGRSHSHVFKSDNR